MERLFPPFASAASIQTFTFLPVRWHPHLGKRNLRHRTIIADQRFCILHINSDRMEWDQEAGGGLLRARSLRAVGLIVVDKSRRCRIAQVRCLVICLAVSKVALSGKQRGEHHDTLVTGNNPLAGGLEPGGEGRA